MRLLEPGETPGIIVAMRWRPHRDGVPGSTHDRRCSACKHPVLLAPETRQLLLTNPAPLWCLECMTAALSRSPMQ